MAALQLFAHLEGETFNVVLLMPGGGGGERANWEALLQGLSNYYNSPGRLAVFRRKLERITRRTDRSCHVCHGAGDFGGPGVWGHGHLRPKPDGPGQVYCGPMELWAATSPSVPPETPIREIVDCCRV